MIGLLRPMTCLATLLLAACEQSGRQADVPVGGGDQWAVDACKTFPAAAAAKASGLAIETTTLGAQVSVAGTTVSSCGYATAGNRESFGVLLRQDTTGKATIDQQVAAITSAPAETGPSEIVEMQKGKAVWQPQLRSLSYVPDDARMIVVTPPFIGLSRKGADPAKLKASAITIARAVAG